MVNDPLSPGDGYERPRRVKDWTFPMGTARRPRQSSPKNPDALVRALRKIHAKARFEVPSR
jgi:hypothetical protein